LRDTDLARAFQSKNALLRMPLRGVFTGNSRTRGDGQMQGTDYVNFSRTFPQSGFQNNCN